MNPEYQMASLSESAIVLSFEQIIDESINDLVLSLHVQVTENPFYGFVESVPAYASLTIFFDVLKVKKSTLKSAADFVKNFMKKLIEQNTISNAPSTKKSIIEIPVTYNGEDLEYVSNHTGFSRAEIISLHTAPIYRVFMMGFLPGFAYLGGMDKRLSVPRLDSPRPKVPAGSVGIAGEQTGIYPTESPGGWQLIGRTQIQLFNQHDKQLTLLKQGDYVRFAEA